MKICLENGPGLLEQKTKCPHWKENEYFPALSGVTWGCSMVICSVLRGASLGTLGNFTLQWQPSLELKTYPPTDCATTSLPYFPASQQRAKPCFYRTLLDTAGFPQLGKSPLGIFCLDKHLVPRAKATSSHLLCHPPPNVCSRWICEISTQKILTLKTF